VKAGFWLFLNYAGVPPLLNRTPPPLYSKPQLPSGPPFEPGGERNVNIRDRVSVVILSKNVHETS
jgi:hypothetical protein